MYDILGGRSRKFTGRKMTLCSSWVIGVAAGASTAACDAIDTTTRNTQAEAMEVHLTDEKRAFIREALEAGRLHREEDAVKEAMSLWEERGVAGWKF